MNLYEEQETEQTEITLEELQEYKASCEEVIDIAKSASKLAENADFKKIIMEQYFHKEPQRLASIMASGRLTESSFNDCVKDLRSIGNLQTFLSDLIQKGNIALESLKEAEEAREEYLNNQANKA